MIIDPIHTLEELNARLWRWIEGEYHQRPHRALEGQTPAELFAQRTVNSRTADPQTDWEALFLSRLNAGCAWMPPSAWRANCGKRPFICAAN